MNNTYCPLPFRETVINPGDILMPCCRNDLHDVPITESFDQAFTFGKLEKMREQLLAGETVKGCEQCYREEAAGVESMRQHSLKKYGVVDNLEIHSIQIQFDNLCNLKCRMCLSKNSHLLFEDELEVLGGTTSKQKFVSTTKHNEIDKTHLKEIKLHGGEPLLSQRANEFFRDLVESKEISKILISTHTNGTAIPSDHMLEAFKQCRFLDILVSIDGYRELNEYIRGKLNFDDVIKTLKFFQSLIDSRPPGSTFIGISTLVSAYNVNKLEKLDSFITSEFPQFKLKKVFLHRPDFLRISCLPSEYKDSIQYSLAEYPKVLKFLNKDDTNYFEEFISYTESLDKMREQSLKNVNPELFEFIESYKSKNKITSVNLQKFYPIVNQLKNV